MADTDATAEPSWGTRLREWRETTMRWSQQELVDRVVQLAYRTSADRGTDLNVGLLQKWENGKVRRPHFSYRRLLAELGAPTPDQPTNKTSDIGLPDVSTPTITANEDESPTEVEAEKPLGLSLYADLEPQGLSIHADSTVLFDRLADPVIFPCHNKDGGITYLTLSRREFLKVARIGASVAGVEIAVSALSGFTPAPSRRVSHHIKRSTSVTGADVEEVRAYTQTFRHLDNKFGGGHPHALAAQFLESDVASMLCGNYTEKTGQELYGAAAQLAHLAAWTAYDMGMHERAQSYFGQALDLAVGAGDHAFSGEVLAAKGHHAIHLNNPHQAIELARASQNAAKKAAVPLLLAEAYALEANAHAFLGESKQCAHYLSQAQNAFARSQPSEVPDWLRYFDEGYLAARIAHSLRDVQDLGQARTYAVQAVDMSDGLTRTRAFNSVILATTHIQSDPDEACSIGIDALEVAVRLQSSRLIRYIGEFRHRLDESHRGEPVVNQFTAQVVEALRS